MATFLKNSVLVDSNILIYALNKTSPKYHDARKFIHETKKWIYVSHQNVLETYRVVTHPTYDKKFGLVKPGVIETFMSQFNIISPNNISYFLALSLFKKHSIFGNKIFDIYLVATMLSYGINEIATDNEKHFKMFKEIKVFNPFR